ncbi:MAG: BamA/TamA family outer membrane protein [Muribaculaceae bacterium]|nr:BamA/TamA family outer membrane protein [Muribaculaceae bacterium]
MNPQIAKFKRVSFRGAVWLTGLILLAACSSTRHVADGNYLLDRVNIEINDSTHSVNASELSTYIRQLPNHKVLWSMKLRLGVYNMSGQDSTKWWNKWIRKLGEPPVIYDSTLMAASIDQLEKAMVNKGFLYANARADTVTVGKKKIRVKYHVDAGRRYIIDSLTYVFPDTVFRNLIMADSSRFVVREGMPLDRNLLESQREQIANFLKNNGYYGFSKEYVTFNADTTSGSHSVDLTMTVNPPYENTGLPVNSHEKYYIRNIRFITDFDPSLGESPEQIVAKSFCREYKDLEIYNNGKSYLRPGVIYENCFLREGMPYSQNSVDRTYSSFSRLGILKFINISFDPVGEEDGKNMLDAYILLTPTKSQTVSFEVEGTNSEGDLGVAAALTYTHRNIGKGSETLTTKLRGAYESLSGNLEGLIHDRYMEYSLDLGVSFPKFKAPFLKENFKRKINASSELSFAISYQERPEYTRIISTAAWSYRWNQRNNKNSYLWTPIDINYVYLPESTLDFIDLIAPDNPLLKYSYEDHFILGQGFTYYHTNKRDSRPWDLTFQRDIYTLRANFETAGNLLYLINIISRPRSHVSEDPYKIFGIHYSQYMRLNSDFSYLHIFDNRNSLAARVGLGIGFPYGNSTILPFEKRFYGGGANGVRGWDVRTLGPGSYPGNNSVSDFINQCGDIRFIMSAEMRTKLFWVIELAAFVDAGNIWTIRNYENQPGGLFRFDKFYKQLAASYGLGLRFDFTYFLLRFDMGMKAHNPAMGEQPWPLIHPRWHRDSSFHFSIGYPF